MAKHKLESLVNRIGAIGAHSADTEEVKLQKTLLIAFSGTMAMLAIVWGGMYFYFEEFTAGAIPLTYAAISFISLAIFSKIKSYSFFLSSQLAFSLMLPFALMVALGGYISSSAVVIWAFTSPLGALVFKGRKQAVYWFVTYLLLLVLAAIFDGYYSSTNNLSTSVVIAFFAMNIIGMSLTVFIVVRYFVGEKNLALTILESKHNWIKEAFSAYISPNIVEHLIKNPDEMKLGGERRDCSFIFTDLVGFTTLVEQSDPATLVSSLNEYFDGMTAIVFKHQGTVTKIVGDAIAVIFSAPVIQEDHAKRAVDCALEMDQYALEFAERKQNQGLALGHTRIGVNSGNVLIGNMGSKNQMDYRALGDAINTAARLESANKQLGTRVCISETTVKQCPDFKGRPIGSLLLKGKTKSVGTFEPLPIDELVSERVIAYNKAYNLMELKDPEAKLAFETLAFDYPNDKLVTYHLTRITAGEITTEIILPLK